MTAQFNTSEAASYSGLAERTIQKFAAAGKIPGAVKDGRNWRFDRLKFYAWEKIGETYVAPDSSSHSRGHDHRRGFIYFLAANDIVKIGFSAQPKRRLAGLKSSLPFETTVLRMFSGTVGGEQALHRRFQHLRVRGEWFRLESEILSYIETRSGRARK